MGVDPISTISWVDSIDEDALKDRVERMVASNPWLTGRFVKRNGTTEIGYNAEPADEEIDELIRVVDDPELGKYGTEGGVPSYSRLMDMVGPHLVRAGLDELNPQVLWKLVIVKPSVLIVSMTHGLGDGSSYYTIFQMLISGKNIRSLPVERFFGLREAKIKVFGSPEEANLGSNWGVILAFVRGFFVSAAVAPWFPGVDRATGRFFLVDNERIKEAKEAVDPSVDGVPYVSTNDIITSWFFKTAGIHHSFMVINLRGRAEELKEPDSIGNNQDLIFYRSPDDAETPSSIRKSLIHMRRAVTGDVPVRPSEIAFNPLSIVTNWSTFADLGAAEGFKIVNHAPVSPIEKNAPHNMAVAIVFEARPGQLGVMVVGTPSKLKNLQAAAPFEDTQADPFMVV